MIGLQRTKGLKRELERAYKLRLKKLRFQETTPQGWQYRLTDEHGRVYRLVLTKQMTQETQQEERKRLQDLLMLVVRTQLSFLEYPLVTVNAEYHVNYAPYMCSVYASVQGTSGIKKLTHKEAVLIGEHMATLHKAHILVPKTYYTKERLEVTALATALEKQYERLETMTKGRHKTTLQRLLLPVKDTLFERLKMLATQEKTLQKNQHVVLVHGNLTPEHILHTNTAVYFTHTEHLHYAPREKDMVLFLRPGLYDAIKQGYERVYKNVRFKRRLLLWYYETTLLWHIHERIATIKNNDTPTRIKKRALRELQRTLIPELKHIDTRIAHIKKLL